MDPIRFYTTQSVPMRPSGGSPLDNKIQESSFGQMLKNTLSDVNKLQNNADDAVQKLATGQDKDIHNTMIAMEKAGVAFQMTMQVRNKMLEAYQEVMRMQV